MEVTQPLKKSRRGPRSRSSQYHAVTYYRRTGRWESHIWDCGKQVYLGGFDTAHAAARAYDRAAIKFSGVEADINFSLEDYHDDLRQSYVIVFEIIFFSPRKNSFMYFADKAPASLEVVRSIEALHYTNVVDGSSDGPIPWQKVCLLGTFRYRNRSCEVLSTKR